MSRFHNLDASIALALDESAPPPDANAPGNPANPDEPIGEPEPDPQPKDEATMADTETPLIERDDYKAGHAAGAAAANERMNAVFASEHTKGREAHAVRLLGNAKLDAADIIAELPNFTKAEALDADAAREAAEEGGRKEMRAEMGKQGNADLGADQNKDGKTGRKAASAVWDRANAAVGRVKKEG